ncbi:MAG: thiazole biosynthesis protein [bacterium]|nr:thiazole biosynthesis protein [bacterium]
MEREVTSSIINSYFRSLENHLQNDLTVVGAGPSGLLCAALVARTGKKVAIFESNNAPGGGIWGGGMLFNRVVVQENVRHILDDFGINHSPAGEGLFDVDAVELASGLIYGTIRSGAAIFNNIIIEDVVLYKDGVKGVVINWTPVNRLKMHVDPIIVEAEITLDGTGHDAVVASTLIRKTGVKLETKTGDIIGERPLWVESGEQSTVENTGRIFPGLYASGMAANNIHGGHRMGPIFGGMLLSGEKAAGMIIEELD